MPGSNDQSDWSGWTFLINVKILFMTWLVWPGGSDSRKRPFLLDLDMAWFINDLMNQSNC